jgi:RHS repeat-associated protein
MFSRHTLRRSLAPLILSVLCSVLPVFAQTDPHMEVGLKPYGAYDSADFDSVSLSNFNLTLRIPLLSYPQRGPLPSQVYLIYNNKSWSVHQTCFNQTCTDHWAWNTPSQQGVYLTADGGAWAVGGFIPGSTVNSYNLYTPDGSSHLMLAANGGYESVDGSGIWWNGSTVNPSFRMRNGNQAGSVDPNGNWESGGPVGFTSTPVPVIGSIQTDTLGRSLSPSQTSTTDYSGCVVPAAPTTINSAYTASYPGPNSTSSLMKVCSATYSLATNFRARDPNCCAIQEGSATWSLIVSVVLYNGTSWTTSPAWGFDYVSRDPGDPSTVNYGDLTKVTLPTGGTISYTWGAGGVCNAGSPFKVLTRASRGVSQRSVNANDGNGPRTWTYSLNDVVTDPNGNDTVHTITDLGGCALYETQTQWFQGSSTSGTLLKTVKTDYTSSPNPFEPQLYNAGSNYPAINVLPIRTTTIWPNGLTTKVEKDYDTNLTTSFGSFSYGDVTAVREYDYGNNSPGPLLRTTNNTYQAFSNSAYLTANLLDLLATQTVLDGNGNQVAQTTYSYDVGSLITSGITTQHDNTKANASARGNRTSICRWLNTNHTNICTSTSYYDTGMPYQVTDARGNVTTYAYSSTYLGAYVTQTTLPQTGSVQHITSGTYDFNTGKLTSFTDQNNLVSNYQYDALWRMSSGTRPDGGQTIFTYPNLTTVQRQESINPTLTKTTTTIADQLGRPTQSQLNSDPQGIVYTDTAYDALGRVYTVSNPYRQGSDPTTSSGLTTYYYDALGRKCLEVPPDGTQPTGGVCSSTQPANTIFTVYSANTTTVTDQTGKSRESVTDGLGHLSQVFEDPGTSPHLNYETDYTYDALDNLLTVNQKGGDSNSAHWRTRTFTYDSLMRLLTSANPETGTITYKYDADTNCASPNSFLTLLVSKTDARGTRTCAQYDALNRGTVLNYSNGDPTITTTYDQSACLSLSACQNIGQKTSMTDAAGSEAWAYQVDATNHRSVHANQRTTNSITKTSTYYMNLAGNVTQAVYPTGRVVNYTYDAASRPVTATDGSSGITYATDFQTAPTGCLTGAVCYTPQGTFYALSIGQTSSFTGLNLTHTYNNRLQPQEFKASSTGGNAIDISYGFVDPITNHNAAHVYSITNNLDTTRSQTFTYDQLNRITSALTTSTHASSPTHCWGETYTLDVWGNLNSIAATTNSNYTGCTEESGFSTTADANNHLPLFSYDASGNTQSDGVVTNYQWDAESQLKSATNGGTTTNYTYDGDGRRVSKVGSKLYWYGSGDDVLAETDASGNTTAEYIYFGGKRIAQVPATGSPIYYVEDLLGTSRVITTNAGVVCYDADFYPYGGERSYTNTCPQNYKFEGKERDTETGNDDFGARYYSNRFGRWLSADWSAVPAPVPYANLSNPQTLNLYSMVADDPESFADLDGHCPTCDAAMELGKDMVSSGNPIAEAIGTAVIGVALVGAALSNPSIRDAIVDGAPYFRAPSDAISYQYSKSQVNTSQTPQSPQDRGRANEQKGLDAANAEKNTKPDTAVDPKTGKEGTTIPDGKRADGQRVEVKDTQRVTDSKQLRLQNEASKDASGKKSVVVTGDKTKVSDTVQGNHEVIRTKDLGPQQQ